MGFSIKINRSTIENKLLNAAERKGLPIAQRKVITLFNRAKGMMMRQFDEHPVTLELRKGARATPLTDATDGYGNLFSFIGFDKGSKPTAPLRELLDNMNIKPTVVRNRKYYFNYYHPTKKQIALKSPMPWEKGNSWVEELESGTMSNLSYYLYTKFNSPKPSKSGWGIQTPWEINGDISFQKTAYLSEILKNFRERVNNIDNNI